MYKNVYNKHLFRLNGGKLQPIINSANSEI